MVHRLSQEVCSLPHRHASGSEGPTIANSTEGRLRSKTWSYSDDFQQGELRRDEGIDANEGDTSEVFGLYMSASG